MKIVRILLVLLCAALLLYGLLAERHEVSDLGTGETTELSGPGFVQTAAGDGLFRKEGRLYDTHSLEFDITDYQEECAA